jgi:DNA-binding NarL/FixJ family response regulator
MRAPDESARHEIAVMVVADVRLYREGLAASLAQRPSLVVVGISDSRQDVLARGPELAPQVIIVDIATHESLELIRDLRHRLAGAKVLAFAVEEVSSEIIECAEAGAAGYVTTGASLDDLVVAIERIAHDELVCSPRIAARLFERMSERGDRPPGDNGDLKRLTTREHEVLDFIRRGHSNKEIAQQLNISEPTVKNHVHHLLEKLAVTTRAQAAARASMPLRRHRPFDKVSGYSV